MSAPCYLRAHQSIKRIALGEMPQVVLCITESSNKYLVYLSARALPISPSACLQENTACEKADSCQSQWCFQVHKTALWSTLVHICFCMVVYSMQSCVGACTRNRAGKVSAWTMMTVEPERKGDWVWKMTLRAIAEMVYDTQRVSKRRF